MDLGKLRRRIRSRVIPIGGTTLRGIMIAVVVVTAFQARAQNHTSPPSPLFADHVPLTLTIALDFDAVFKDRAEERDYQPATLHLSGNGAETAHAIGIKSRGYYRLHYLRCDVPPLRLNFKKTEVAGTVFDGQDKLKLVSHCRNSSDRYQQYLFQEYLIYRTYNLLTDASFHARLVHLTYVDSRDAHKPVTAYGFLIEEDERMAERNGASIIGSGVRISPDAIDRDAMTLLSVFQYLIGNTDWTISTYHNIRLIFVDSTRTMVAVPYDFDWSGLISTPYATPFAELGIRSVRERKYMGPCRGEAELAAVFQRFSDLKEKILAVFEQSEHLEERYIRRSVDYLNEFFETIRNPRKIRREFKTTCA